MAISAKNYYISQKAFTLCQRVNLKYRKLPNIQFHCSQKFPLMTDPYTPLSDRLIDTYRARKPKKYYKLSDWRADGKRLIKFGIYPREKMNYRSALFRRIGWEDAT